MRTLRLLLVFLVGAGFAWFATANWTWVPIELPAGLNARVRLPALLFAALLLGALPGLVTHPVSRWRWKRRLAASERRAAALEEELASAKALQTPPAASVPPPEPDVPFGPASSL